jgi:hypothetical protein
MKKINLIIISFVALLLFSCDPNKDVYEQLDAQRVPFNQSLSYTLTEDDYTTIKSLALANAENAEDSALANDIASNLSFSDERPAANYIPDFLAETFIALDSASSITVGYNFDHTFTFSNDQRYSFSDTVTSSNSIASILNDTVENPQEGDFILARHYFSSNGEVERIYNLFTYENDTWTSPENSYVLKYEDYENMGLPYHDFRSGYDADFYMPIFMNKNYPYNTAGDVMHIVYRYNSSNVTYYKYNLMYYDGTTWNWDEQKQDQYLHNGEKWVFDPTVSYTLVSDAYQIIVDWIIANDTLSDYVGYDNRREFYFGANAKYTDFNMNISERKANDPNGYLTGMSDEDIETEIYNRLIQAINIVLEEKYPDAVPFVNGVPVYYNVTFLTWVPAGTTWYTIKFLCTDTGTFEYVEGPTAVE